MDMRAATSWCPPGVAARQPKSAAVILQKQFTGRYIILRTPSCKSCAMLLKITRCMRTRIVSKAAIGSRSDVT